MSFIIEKHCYNGEIGDDIFYNMYKIRLTIVLSKKYTCNRLKHILKIGLKAHHYGGIN